MYKCEPCEKEFSSKDALKMHNLAKHKNDLSHLSKKERKFFKNNEKEKNRGKLHQKKIIKKTIIYSLIILLVGVAIYLFLTKGHFESYSDGQVHWHANFKINVCGENVPLPNPTGGSVHGQTFIGTPLMHLHNEPIIHVEGVIGNKEDITLEKFMNSIGLNFNENELLKYKNGDLCPNGQEGQIKLLVNGIKSNELTNKIVVDGEDYELIFG